MLAALGVSDVALIKIDVDLVISPEDLQAVVPAFNTLIAISIALDLSMRCAPRNTERNITPRFPTALAINANR